LRRKSARDHDAWFVVPAGGMVSAVSLVLIAWMFSSSTWTDAGQALLAGAIGLLLHAVYGWRRRVPGATLDAPSALY